MTNNLEGTSGYIIYKFRQNGDSWKLWGEGYVFDSKRATHQVNFTISYNSATTPSMTYNLEYITPPHGLLDRKYITVHSFHDFNTVLTRNGFPEFKKVHVNSMVPNYNDFGHFISHYFPGVDTDDIELRYQTMANLRSKAISETSGEPESNALKVMSLASNPGRKMLEFMNPEYDRVRSQVSKDNDEEEEDEEEHGSKKRKLETEYGGGGRRKSRHHRTKRLKYRRNKSRRQRR